VHVAHRMVGLWVAALHMQQESCWLSILGC
jgi:hypothetical protein